MFNYRHNWGEYRVWFFDDGQRLRSLPATWTDYASVDPFVAVADGRAALHPGELLRLAALVGVLETSPPPPEEG